MEVSNLEEETEKIVRHAKQSLLEKQKKSAGLSAEVDHRNGDSTKHLHLGLVNAAKQGLKVNQGLKQTFKGLGYGDVLDVRNSNLSCEDSIARARENEGQRHSKRLALNCIEKAVKKLDFGRVSDRTSHYIMHELTSKSRREESAVSRKETLNKMSLKLLDHDFSKAIN